MALEKKHKDELAAVYHRHGVENGQQKKAHEDQVKSVKGHIKDQTNPVKTSNTAAVDSMKKRQIEERKGKEEDFRRQTEGLTKTHRTELEGLRKDFKNQRQASLADIDAGRKTQLQKLESVPLVK